MKKNIKVEDKHLAAGYISMNTMLLKKIPITDLNGKYKYNTMVKQAMIQNLLTGQIRLI
jgi:hypothetical protein